MNPIVLIQFKKSSKLSEVIMCSSFRNVERDFEKRQWIGWSNRSFSKQQVMTRNLSNFDHLMRFWTKNLFKRTHFVFLRFDSNFLQFTVWFWFRILERQSVLLWRKSTETTYMRIIENNTFYWWQNWCSKTSDYVTIDENLLFIQTRRYWTTRQYGLLLA